MNYFSTGQQFLSQKGFGFLLENESDDHLKEIEERPLLEELEIDPRSIIKKLTLIAHPYFAFQPLVAAAISIFKRIRGQTAPESSTEEEIFMTEDSKRQLREPEFWGPLFCVVCYAALLAFGSLSIISWLFSFWIIGSFCIFVLSRLLIRDGAPAVAQQSAQMANDISMAPFPSAPTGFPSFNDHMVIGVDRISSPQQQSQQPQLDSNAAVAPQISLSQVIGFVGFALVPVVVAVLLIKLLNVTLPIPALLFALKALAVFWSASACCKLIVLVERRVKKNLLLVPLILLYVYFASLSFLA